MNSRQRDGGRPPSLCVAGKPRQADALPRNNHRIDASFDALEHSLQPPS